MKSQKDMTKTLESQGWRRHFTAAEPRLSEAAALYRELGFEVHLESIPGKGETSGVRMPHVEKKCSACYEGSEDHYKIIFTRPTAKGDSCSG